jgi:hypothetical protein
LKPLRERLLSRLAIDPSGCLLFTGGLTKDGYGQLKAGPGAPKYTHRLMYEMFVGPIPEGMTIDHLCRVRHCAAPAHLEVVTKKVNTLRGVAPVAANAKATHCIRGHEFDLINTRYRTDRPGRVCRTCERARNQAAKDPANDR